MDIRLLPSEIVLNILTNVDPFTIHACRLVCRQWRDVVDNYIYTDEKIWKEYCHIVYPRTCDKAKYNAHQEMTYFQLFKTITLWNSVSVANIQAKCLNFHIPEKIRNMQLDRYGRINIHTKDNIFTFDYILDTIANAPVYKGNYLEYAENLYYFLVLALNRRLIVIFKEKLQPAVGNESYIIPDVTSFTLYDTQIYVLTTIKEFTCYCFERGLMKRVILFWPETAHIWSVEDNEILFLTTQNHLQKYFSGAEYRINKSNAFFYCVLYGFFNNVSLTAKEAWFLQEPQFRMVTCLYSYNYFVFAGTAWGVIKVFRVNPVEAQFGTPLKTIQLVEDIRSAPDCAVQSIHIIEDINLHRMLVTTTHRVFMISFTHDNLL